MFFRHQDDPLRAAELVIRTCSQFLGTTNATLWEIDRRRETEVRIVLPLEPVSLTDVTQVEAEGSHFQLLRALPRLHDQRLPLGCRVLHKGTMNVLRIPFKRREYVVLFDFPNESQVVADSETQLELRAVGDLLQDAIFKAMCRYVGKKRASKGDFSLGNIFYEGSKTAGFLFGDIRGFTTLCDALVQTRAEMHSHVEKLKLPSVDEILKQFSKRAGRVIFEYGRLERIMGDGVLGIMGDMEELSRVPYCELSRAYRKRTCVNAIACAIRMQHEFKGLLRDWRPWLDVLLTRRSEALSPRLGIGIGFGEARFGLFGTDDYREYSADGGHVNYAHRLSSLACKRIGAADVYEEVLLSQPVVSALDEEDLDEVVRTHSICLDGSNVEHAVYGIRRGTTKRPYSRFWEKLRCAGQDVDVTLPKKPWEKTGDNT